MTVAIADDLRAKIERRSRRAWRHHRRGDDRSFSRITDVTERTLLYRIPDGSPHSHGWYGTKKLKVTRKNGEITVEAPPRDALLDLQTTSDLWKLQQHMGRVRAYKYANEDGKSPTYPVPEITWKVGTKIEVKNASTNKSDDCAEGINLGTYDWCSPQIKSHNKNRLFAVEFEIEDLAAVPNSSAGKFRVFRCTVVEELTPGATAKLPMTPSGPQQDDPLLDTPSRKKAREKEARRRRQRKRAQNKKDMPLNIDKAPNERPDDESPIIDEASYKTGDWPHEQKMLPTRPQPEPKKGWFKSLLDRFRS